MGNLWGFRTSFVTFIHIIEQGVKDTPRQGSLPVKLEYIPRSGKLNLSRLNFLTKCDAQNSKTQQGKTSFRINCKSTIEKIASYHSLASLSIRQKRDVSLLRDYLLLRPRIFDWSYNWPNVMLKLPPIKYSIRIKAFQFSFHVTDLFLIRTPSHWRRDIDPMQSLL